MHPSIAEGETREGKAAGPRLRFFSGSPTDPRARRAGDVIALAVSAIGLSVLAAVAIPPSRAESALIELLGSLPDFFDVLWRIAVDLLTVLAAVVFSVALLQRRGGLLRDLIVAVGLAAAVALSIGRLVEGEWPDVWATMRAGPSAWPFPATQIALAGAVVTTASPHLGRPYRRVGSSAMWSAVISSAIVGAATPSRALAGVLVAVMSGAGVHLLFGSSRGWPRLDDVAAALAELGVRTRSLSAADRQPAGVFVAAAEDDTGRSLLVKVYGRDASDAEILASVRRRAWYREPGAPIMVGRLWQVEHEALLTLLAARQGIPTYEVVVAGATARSDAVLVLRPRGRPMTDPPASYWSPTVMHSMWETLRRLHRAGIAHGHVDRHHLFVVGGDDDGTPDEVGAIGLVDFGDAVVGAGSDRMRRDQAQLFVATVLAAGDEAACIAGREALGAEGLAAVLPLLQMPVLTVGQRRQVREEGIDLDEIRDGSARLLEIDRPELQRLRRVTLRSLLQPTLMVMAFLAVAQVVGRVDAGAVWEELARASWWLIGVGVVLSQVPRFAQVFSTFGASPIPLPIGPVYALQLGVAYINLVVPSSAARIAVNVRFLQRQGMSRGGAVAVGAVDGFGGFLVQIIVVAALLTFTGASLDLDLSGTLSEGPGRLLGFAVGLVALAGVVIVAVPGWRKRLAGPGREFVAEALAAVRGLRSPRRLGLLAGGNLASDLFLALALSAFTRSFGYHVGLGELMLIIVGVSLLAGVLPVPGGIGVIEGGLIFGLVSAGVADESAFAIVVVHRLATFYLPPVWGFVAFRWLERNQYL